MTVMTPSEAAPVVSIMKIDEAEPGTVEEPELPDMVAVHAAEVEPPSNV